MLRHDQVIQIIHDKIFNDVKPGDYTGSSGHTGNKEVEIIKVHPLITETGWEVDYEYVVTIETEFTIYPDNPPNEERFRVKAIMDSLGKVLYEKKEWIKMSGGFDLDKWSENIPE